MKCKIPDKAYQDGLLNILELGEGKDSDAHMLLTKNKLVTVRHAFSYVIEKELEFSELPHDLPGIQCRLSKVIYWILQEQAVLREIEPEEIIEFKLTLDGRPFASRNQILVGIVCTSDEENLQSSKFVYPICIIDGKESIDIFNSALENVTDDRSELEKSGIEFGPFKFKIDFVGVADLSALYKLLDYTDESNIKLGEKGLGEMCFMCKCKRGCECEETADEDRRKAPCENCKDVCKISIGSYEFKVLRDDLECKLGIPISKLVFCILHAELRNEENWLKDLALICHSVGCLDELNRALAKYGPESFTRDRITIEKKKVGNIEEEVSRKHVKVASFSGPQAWKFIIHGEEIVRAALPLQKVVKELRNKDPLAFRQFVENYLKFYGERVKYYNDMLARNIYEEHDGLKAKTLKLDDTPALVSYIKRQKEFWETHLKRLNDLYNSDSSDVNYFGNIAKETTIGVTALCAKFLREVCSGLRHTEFRDPKNPQAINKFEIDAYEWAFTYKFVGGPNLGGHYFHILTLNEKLDELFGPDALKFGRYTKSPTNTIWFIRGFGKAFNINEEVLSIETPPPNLQEVIVLEEEEEEALNVEEENPLYFEEVLYRSSVSTERATSGTLQGS